MYVNMLRTGATIKQNQCNKYNELVSRLICFRFYDNSNIVILDCELSHMSTLRISYVQHRYLPVFSIFDIVLLLQKSRF
jgi:hypothetical protein